MVNNNHGYILGNGSLNAESDKKYRSCVFIWCRRWLNIGWIRPTAWGGFAFLFTRNAAHHSQRPLIRKIYLHKMHIYTFAALTDIAAIVYNIGMRRTESPLKIGIAWLCRTVLRILFSKLGERINIHLTVMRSILRNSERKPSWTRQRTRLRSNTSYEFAAQFTNANYMVANRYSFNPTPNNQKKGIQACVLPFAALIRKHGEVFGGFAIFHLHGERNIYRKKMLLELRLMPITL